MPAINRFLPEIKPAPKTRRLAAAIVVATAATLTASAGAASTTEASGVQVQTDGAFKGMG